ncbi:MAG: hypothetical protein AAGF66_13735 [Cyanobacteria bacterium P01_H01_bin.119]
MSTFEAGFSKADYLLRRRNLRRWHERQCKTQILRSQVGFTDTAPTRPKACNGCANYHGISYGTQRNSRTLLICAMYPYGWPDTARPCPDWQSV